MQKEYDSEVDGLFIWFLEDIEKAKGNFEKEVWPSELNNEIGFLFNTDGKILGIEVQPASKYFDEIFLNSL